MNSMDYLGDRAEEVLSTLGPLPTPTLTDTEVHYGVEVLSSGAVVVGGAQLPDCRLTKKEADLLAAVLRRRGVATKEFILAELYAGMDEPELKIIDVFTCKLRRKLGEHGGMVETVWGRGYQRSAAYRLLDPGASLAISPKLRARLEGLAQAVGRRSDELGEELLLKAVQEAERRTWA